jgi:paraquat-inducible protein B
MMEEINISSAHHACDDELNKIKRKLRKIRRVKKDAEKTLVEIPQKIKEHNMKLVKAKKIQKKRSGLDSLIIQLEFDIEKRQSALQLSIQIADHTEEYNLTRAQQKDQTRLNKMKQKVSVFKSEAIYANCVVEYARKCLYSSQQRQDKTIRYLVKDHIPNVLVPYIMAYLGNQTQYSSSNIRK